MIALELVLDIFANVLDISFCLIDFAFCLQVFVSSGVTGGFFYLAASLLSRVLDPVVQSHDVAPIDCFSTGAGRSKGDDPTLQA